MEDDSIIKKVGIAKLNGSNYWTWVAIIKAVMEVKDMWDAIKQLVLEAKTSKKSIDNGTVEDKVAVTSKTDRVMDIKTRIIIIKYYK